jgi:hypothetical protein
VNPDENQPQTEQSNDSPAPSNDLNNPAPAPVAEPAMEETTPTEPAPIAEPAPQTVPTMNSGGAPASQAKSSKRLVILGLILVVVGAIVGGVLYFISK